MPIMYRIFLLFFFVCGVFGQIYLPGECNYADLNYIQKVNVNETYGTWHQIARVSNNVEIGDCSSLTISQGNGTDHVQFSFAEIFNKTLTTANGTIQEVEDSPGFFKMNFDNNMTLNFVLLTTNHSEVSVLYSCHQFENSTKLVWGWQYNRNATLSSHEKEVANSIVSGNPDLKNATWIEDNRNSTVCTTGNSGMRFPTPHILTILSLVFLAKAFA